MFKHRPLAIHSVGFVLTIALVLVTTLVLFGFGYYNYHTRSVMASRELSVNAQRMADRLAKSIALAVWNMDVRQVRESLLSEMAQDQVQELAIREPDGVGIFAAKGRDESWNPVDVKDVPVDDQAVFAKAPIEHLDQRIGIIEVTLTRKFVQADLRQMLWDTAVSTLLVDVSVVVILLSVITLLVLRPLAAMQGYAQAVGSGDLDCQAMSGIFLGELGALKTHLEAMVCSLSANLEELRQKSQEIAASEERYRSVIQNMQDVYFRTDAEGRLIMLSPSGVRMYGVQSMAEMLGHPLSEFYTAQDERKALQARLAAEGVVRDHEVLLKRKDGSLVQAAATVSYYRDPAGNILGVEGIFRDITERKQAEERLRQSEARIRALFNATSDSAILMDTDGVILAINEHGAKRRGLRPEDLVGHFIYETLPPHSAGLRRMQTKEAVRTKSPRTYEEERSGAFYSITIYPILESEDIPRQVASFSRDITERKRAEEALRQSEERFSRIFELAPECITFVRLSDALTIDANAAFETITGYPREEAMGRPVTELALWDDLKTRDEFIARLLDEGHVKDFEFLLRRKDGALRRVVSSAQLVNIAGEACFISVIHDITDERRMQELLIQSEKMMSVGSLAAGIAHEINNPLGIVHQAVQNLILRTSPDQKKNLETAAALGLRMDQLQAYLKARKLDVFLEDIRIAALRASDIIRNMLNFSRRSESKRQACDLHRIIEQSVFLASSDYDLKKSYDFKRIEIGLDLGQKLPACNCTETEIEQVLLNLLRNAAQAMSMANPPTPNPRIDIRLRAGEGCVRLEVADNGPGISPDVQRKVFEPFFTTKPPGVGTGLGLSVSYFIITKGHGGRMWMSSTPGRGTTFFIELPAEGQEACDV